MKKNLKDVFSNNKGITLLALVITMILLVIVASIAIPEGATAIENSKMTTFSAELQTVQEEANKLNQKLKDGDESVLNIGESLQNTNEETIAFTGAGIVEPNASEMGFRYYDKKTLESLGLQDFSQEFLVSVKTRQAISLQGIKYRGDTYYTLSQLPNGLYNVEYNENINSFTIFDLNYSNVNGELALVLTNIQYFGNVKKGTIYYGQGESEDTVNWKTAINNTADTSYRISIPNEGKWYVKIIDAAGNSSVIYSVEVK